VATTPSWSS